MLILIATITICIVFHKKDLAKENFNIRKGIVIKPFQIFLIGFFITATVLFYPIYYTDFFVADHGFVKVLKSILLSIHNVLRLFVLDGEFDNVRDLLSDSARVSTCIGSIYSIYAALIYITAPALTAGVVLSFFKGASAFIRYSLYLHADIYILSELNERSLILAQDILTNKTDKTDKTDKTNKTGKTGKSRKLVVFTDVFEKDEEANFELVSQAKRLGAICMRKDILEVGLKRSKNVFRKIYLIGEDEDENIKQALELIERCRKTPRYNTYKTQIYVFANSVESEVLLNSIDNGKIKVRRLSENINLVIHTLNNYSIFADACTVNDKKEISVAIIGLGAYGVELLKAICWCGQMPGYSVTIHAFDKESGKDKIKNIAPELIKYNGKKIEGEPYYKIVFHDNIDVKSYKFQEELSKIDLISSAFVTLGDDELNIEVAMKMRIQFGRDNISLNKHIPPIYAVVYSMEKTQVASHGGIKNMCDEDYGISFIGSIQSRYSIESIERNDLEEKGLTCHLHWVEQVDDADAREKYNKYEYYRRSSIAEAIYLRFRKTLITDTTDPELLKEYEHKRWSAYMRSEGYVGLGGKRDDIAKTHPSLVPYQDLTAEEQNKDAMNTEAN